MRIFEVVPQLSTGGAERFVVDLCNELSVENEVVLVVLWPLKGDQSFFLQQLSEKVIIECVNKKPGFDFRVFSRLYKLVKQFRPQIIHSHIDSIFYTWPFQVFFSKGVHTIHSSARHEAVNMAHRLIRFVFFHLKCIYPVTISKVSKDDFDSFYHIKSKLIINGRNIPDNLMVSECVKAEIDGYKASDNTKVIVHLAHVDTIKRQLLMAKVAKRLQN